MREMKKRKGQREQKRGMIEYRWSKKWGEFMERNTEGERIPILKVLTLVSRVSL